MANQYNFQSEPQPRTIAPSREDVLSNLMYFYFPDAYAGSNTKIRDTLNNLILKSPQNWQTSVGLPFFSIQGTVVEWDEIRFDVRLMQRVPYEGVSRMQTSLRRRHRDRVVRRGLGLVIESDFYATEAGRQHFADQLTSIRYCVQETCNFDTLYAYLTCGNYDFNYDRLKNLRPRKNIRSAMNHEIQMFACAQKEQQGLDKAVEECKYRMSRYGVSPNMLIIPPQDRLLHIEHLALYMALAPESKLTYKEGGPAAEARFQAGVAGFESASFRGCGVFTSEPFEVSDDADAVQMLTRSTQNGEFYLMSPPTTMGGANGDGWRPHMCDMIIYDEEADKHVRIAWEEALAATMIDPNNPGSVGGVAVAQLKGGPAAGGGGLADWYNLAAEWAAWNVESNAAQKKADFDRLRGRPIPYIVVARPFIEHLMHSVILTVAGRDTGATLFGPADMQLSANTQVKTIEGHYTGHFKAVITKPQNVLVMRDVACAGYVAGGNTAFFGKNGTRVRFGKQVGIYTPDAVREAIQDRLAFTNQVGAKYASMLAFPMFEDQMNDAAGGLDTVMSVTSRLLPWNVTGTNSQGMHDSFPGGEECFQAYKAALALDTIHFGEDLRAAENQDFISQGSTNNAVCFMGPHRKFDGFANSFFSLTPGQGHFGPDAIPGDARWRRGDSVSLKAARDSMVSLELAAHSQMTVQYK